MHHKFIVADNVADVVSTVRGLDLDAMVLVDVPESRDAALSARDRGITTRITGSVDGRSGSMA